MASFWQSQKGIFNDKVLAINKMSLFFLYSFFNAYIHLQCGIKLAHLPVDWPWKDTTNIHKKKKKSNKTDKKCKKSAFFSIIKKIFDMNLVQWKISGDRLCIVAESWMESKTKNIKNSLGAPWNASHLAVRLCALRHWTRVSMPPTTQSLRHPLTRAHHIAPRIKTARRSRRKTPDDKMNSWKEVVSISQNDFAW